MTVTKRERSLISSALRKIWFWYNDSRKAVIKRCMVKRGEYKCENCGQIYKGKAGKVLQVDHIERVGSIHEQTLDEYVKRLFCPITNLWGLCKICHDKKTYLERNNFPVDQMLEILKERKPDNGEKIKTDRERKIEKANLKRLKRRSV